MKKAFKIAGLILGIAIALVILASVALQLSFPKEKVRVLLEKQLAAHLKREVKLGKISVSLLGISISPVEISEAPGFAQGTFISSDQFSIRVAILPLLSRRLELHHLILKHPVINLVRHPDGKNFNFSDIIASESQERSNPPASVANPRDASEPTLDLTVSVVEIENAVLHFQDRSPERLSINIDPLDLTLKNFSLSSPFTVNASLTARARRVTATLKLAGEANLAEGSFQAKTCELASGGSSLSLTGQARELLSAKPVVDLLINIRAFSLATIAPFVTLPPELKLDGPIAGQISAKGDLQQLTFAADVALDKVNVVYGREFSKPDGIVMRFLTAGTWAGPKIQLQSLSAVLGSLELTGRGALQTGRTPPRFQLALTSNHFSLEKILRLIPSAAAYRLAGTAFTEVQASGTASAPVVKGTLTLQNASLQAAPNELSDIAATASFTLQDVSVPQLTAKLNGSDLKVKLTGRSLTTHPDITVEGSLVELDLEKLLPAPAAVSLRAERSNLPGQLAGLLRRWAPRNDDVAWAIEPPAAPRPMKLAGHFTIGHIQHELYDAWNMDLRWNLTDVTADLAHTSGSLLLQQGKGLLKDVNKLGDQSKIARVILLPIAILQRLEKLGVLKVLRVPSLQTIPVTGIQGDYLLNAGMMTVRMFDLMGRDMSMKTTGTIGLPDPQPLDLRVHMKLSPGGVVGLVIPFSIQGDVASPEVRAGLLKASRKTIGNLGGKALNGIGLGSDDPQSPPPPP